MSYLSKKDTYQSELEVIGSKKLGLGGASVRASVRTSVRESLRAGAEVGHRSNLIL